MQYHTFLFPLTVLITALSSRLPFMNFPLDDDFSIDQKTKAISISLDGISKIEKYLKVKNIKSNDDFDEIKNEALNGKRTSS